MQTGEATLLIVSVPIVKVRMNKENLIFRLNKTI